MPLELEASNLSQLTPIIFNMELTHLGSKASYYLLISFMTMAKSNTMNLSKILTYFKGKEFLFDGDYGGIRDSI